MQMNRPKPPVTKPIINREQFAAIAALFPARYLPSSTPEAEVREYMGTQKVLAELKKHVA